MTYGLASLAGASSVNSPYLSPSVDLPRNWIPRFPDCCVECGKPQPGASVSIRSYASGQHWLIAMAAIGRQVVIDVPACPDCGPRVESARWGWSLAGLVRVVIALAVVIVLQQIGLETLGFGLLMAAMIAALVWHWFVSPPAIVVGIRGASNEVNYRFRDADYRREFAALNRTASRS